MYLEHDMSVPWTALLGWAEDMPILEPLNFQRGFYRVEPSGQSGLAGLTDQISRININKYNLKLNISTLYSDGQIKVRHQPALQSNITAPWHTDLCICVHIAFSLLLLVVMLLVVMLLLLLLLLLHVMLH